MSIEELLKKRKQTRYYNLQRYPSVEIVKELVDKSFDLTASKQNLYPYKVHIIGPNDKNIMKALYEITCIQSGGDRNFNILSAPYCLIFTTRLVKNPDTRILANIKKGHKYSVCDPELYNNMRSMTAIEIGMFSKVLTSLCLEKNIDVSYQLCFPEYSHKKEVWKKLPFIEDPVLFIMQLGYKTGLTNYNVEKKPNINEVINWIKPNSV